MKTYTEKTLELLTRENILFVVKGEYYHLKKGTDTIVILKKCSMEELYKKALTALWLDEPEVDDNECVICGKDVCEC